MAKSMTKYLCSIPSAVTRTKIRKEARRRGFKMARIGSENKEILADAVFAVLNEREHRNGFRDSLVVAMRAVQNNLYDDLGWNEYQAAKNATCGA
ncbi:MAG: hypothetical protein WCI73_09750 [Phycisphaerae bacterium]